MTDQEIKKIAEQYRIAIEVACDDHRFGNDLGFNEFPKGSCGDTCYLLAQHLLDHYGVKTLWISAERGIDSHAWLVVKDSRVKEPDRQFFEAPEEIINTLNVYSNGAYTEPVDITRYEKGDIAEGLIIDITADQFSDFDEPVYVGYMDPFHDSFEFISATEHDGLHDGRLNGFYRIVEEYLRF